METTDNIFVKSILTDTVKIDAKYVSKNYKDVVKEMIKKRNEGVCTKHGYIKPNSLEILKYSVGKLRMISLNGDILCTAQFKADICNPVIGSVVKGKVTNINKFGVLVETTTKILDEDGNPKIIPVMEIIITKQGAIKSDIDISKVAINDQVNVKILGKKFELNDKKISAIGCIVSNTTLPTEDNPTGGGDTEINVESEIDDQDVEDDILDEEDEEADVEAEAEAEADVLSVIDEDDESGFDLDGGDDFEDDVPDEEDFDVEDGDISDSYSI